MGEKLSSSRSLPLAGSPIETKANEAVNPATGRRSDQSEKMHDRPSSQEPAAVRSPQELSTAAWEHQLDSMIDRIKDLHGRMIHEELDLLSTSLRRSPMQGALVEWESMPI